MRPSYRWMRFPIVTVTLTDVLPVDVVLAVQSSHIEDRDWGNTPEFANTQRQSKKLLYLHTMQTTRAASQNIINLVVTLLLYR